MSVPDPPVPGSAPGDLFNSQLIHGRIPGGPHGLARFRPGDGQAAGDSPRSRLLVSVENCPHPVLQLADRLKLTQALGQSLPERLSGYVVNLHHLDQLGFEHFNGRAVLDNKIARIKPKLSVNRLARFLAGMEGRRLPRFPGPFKPAILCAQ